MNFLGLQQQGPTNAGVQTTGIHSLSPSGGQKCAIEAGPHSALMDLVTALPSIS